MLEVTAVRRFDTEDLAVIHDRCGRAYQQLNAYGMPLPEESGAVHGNSEGRVREDPHMMPNDRRALGKVMAQRAKGLIGDSRARTC